MRSPESRNPEDAVGRTEGGKRGGGGEGGRTKILPRASLCAGLVLKPRWAWASGLPLFRKKEKKASASHFVRVEQGARGAGWAPGTQQVFRASP